MTIAPVLIPEEAPVAIIPEWKNPPGRWRSVDCALGSHGAKCTERRCGCRCHEEDLA